MSPRDQPFLANSPKLGGAVTRFAIVGCWLDLARGVAVLTVVLEWVLNDSGPEQGDGVLATPWQATFFKRDATLRTERVAVVVASPAEVQQDRYRFRVEAEIRLPLDEPLHQFDATIRRLEDVARSPVADLIGYAYHPDVDTDHGTFTAESLRWLRDGNLLGSGDLESFRGASASASASAGAEPPEPPPVASVPAGPASVASARPVPPPMPQKSAAAPVSLPAAARTANTDPAEAPAPKAPESEPADLAVFCPPDVGRATSFLVQAYLYPPAKADLARAQAREADAGAERRGVLSLPLDLPRGTRVDLRLEMPGLRIDEPDTILVWRGDVAAAQFEVAVPNDVALGTVIGRIRLSIAGVPCGTLRFQVVVAAAVTNASARAAEVGVWRYRRAFVSYSSKDRAEVLRRVQAFRIAGLSVFQDVLDLEPGDRWERGLYRELDECDVVLLFWSRAAAESPWVAKEIDYALARKQGQDDRPPDIQPVPIEGPPIPPPPEKLRHLHFNDALLAHIAAAQGTAPIKAL
jgi:hypothetical protein